MEKMKYERGYVRITWKLTIKVLLVANAEELDILAWHWVRQLISYAEYVWRVCVCVCVCVCVWNCRWWFDICCWQLRSIVCYSELSWCSAAHTVWYAMIYFSCLWCHVISLPSWLGGKCHKVTGTGWDSVSSLVTVMPGDLFLRMAREFQGFLHNL